MTAMFIEGQPVFEVTRCILPHTLIVARFNEKLLPTPHRGFVPSLKKANQAKLHATSSTVTSQGNFPNNINIKPHSQRSQGRQTLLIFCWIIYVQSGSISVYSESTHSR